MAEGAGRGGGHGAQFMENGHGFRPPFHPRGARGGHRGRGGQRPGLAPSSSAPQGLSTEPQQWKLHEYTARGEGGSLDLAARLASDPSPLPSIFCLLEGVGAADLHRPIGLCVLATGHLVVASTFENKVKMFGEDGRLVKVVVLPERPFHKPSDMVALQQGGFVVRDDQGLHLFSGAGEFQHQLSLGRGGKCYGLAQDHLGRLVTLHAKRGEAASLLFLDMVADKVVTTRHLVDAVGARAAASKCRFLAHCQGRLYVTDLGLDRVYVLDAASLELLLEFGQTGTGPGCFNDAAGLGVDGAGNILVADSKNHRIALFDKTGSPLAEVPLGPAVRRPSGLLVDVERRALYVLCLQGQKALVKYDLK